MEQQTLHGASTVLVAGLTVQVKKVDEGRGLTPWGVMPNSQNQNRTL